MRSLLIAFSLGICLAVGFRIPIPEKYKRGDANFAIKPHPDVGKRHKNYNPDTDKVYPFELGAGYYYQYDIMLRPAGRTARNAIPLTSTDADIRWPDATVPYVITGSFAPAELTTIQTTMSQFTGNTCVKFVPQTNEAIYLTIANGASGCWAYVGRSLDNTYNLANLQNPSCMVAGTVAHELMHALGFYHEFIRPDRDSWVSINSSALYPQFQTTAYYDANFAELASSQSELFGIPYNYGSVMHYSKFAGAASYSWPVMNNLQPWTGDFGSNTGLTASDIQSINYMYCNSTG